MLKNLSIEIHYQQNNFHVENSSKNRFSTIPGRVPEFWERSKGCHFADRCSRAKKNCSKEIPNEINFNTDHFVKCFYPY